MYESMNKTPILTCFVSSLAAGTPFRVSIHSWERPTPSSLLKSRKAEDEPVAFEARVYVDGKVQSKRLFREGNIWPEVIETKSRMLGAVEMCADPSDGRFSEREADLIFPAFHPEILQQPRWEPGEQLGRIQIVLTEGVLREASNLHTNARKVAFDGLRDVIAFSFQHAPKDVLEYSGIAWPNSRLFEGRNATTRRQVPQESRTPSYRGHDAHSHSPRQPTSTRQDVWVRIADKAEQSYKDYAFRSAPPATSRFAGPQMVGSTSNALSGYNDPFMAPVPESSLGWRSAGRKTSTDESMPDYVSHGTDTSRADTDMSINWPRRDFQRHMDEAAIEEIVQALSPSKKGQLLQALSPSKVSSSGVQAPVNTPSTDLDRGGSQEATPKDGLSKGIAGNSGKAVANARLGLDMPAKAITTRSMTTRSMKPGAGFNTEDIDLLQHRRARSSSGSSKRKRSLSPFVQDSKRELKLNVTPPAIVQARDVKRPPLPIDESGSESESVASMCDTEDRESSTTSKGVSLDL